MTTNNAINAPIPFTLAKGGTGAALTASNGGIVYSNATTLAILAGTATASQVLVSGSSTTPAWSTATYPTSTTVNRILYSTSSNVIGELSTTNSAALTTTAAGAPAWLALTDGQVVVGSSAGAPAAATISAGANISVTNGHNTITIAATGPGSFAWVDQNSSSVTMAVNTGYVTDNGASLVTYTLPTTSALGSIIEVIGYSSGGWVIDQNASQLIHLGNVVTTTGTGGSLASSNAFDSLRMICTVANTTWVVASVVGNITYV